MIVPGLRILCGREVPWCEVVSDNQLITEVKEAMGQLSVKSVMGFGAGLLVQQRLDRNEMLRKAKGKRQKKT